MMFSLIIFHWSAMDGHSKREVLEIFNMNKKNVVAWFLSVNRHQMVDNLRLFERPDVLKGDNFFMFAKFWFSAIIYVEVIAE